MKCCVQDGNIYTICAECIYLQGDVVSQKMFIFFFFFGWLGEVSIHHMAFFAIQYLEKNLLLNVPILSSLAYPLQMPVV